jgi:hypothetical protein
MVAVPGLGGPSSGVQAPSNSSSAWAAPAAAIPARAAGPSPTTDRIKTILAAIGLIALLYHALRLLGTAVG